MFLVTKTHEYVGPDITDELFNGIISHIFERESRKALNGAEPSMTADEVGELVLFHTIKIVRTDQRNTRTMTVLFADEDTGLRVLREGYGMNTFEDELSYPYDAVGITVILHKEVV